VFKQKAKEADDFRAALDAKVAALTAAEGQLLRERTTRQGDEGRLQQEQAALVDARSALERERVAREAAQMSLEDRNIEFSKVGRADGAQHHEREPGAGPPGARRDRQGPRVGGRGRAPCLRDGEEANRR
jgi:cell division protein FtsL